MNPSWTYKEVKDKILSSTDKIVSLSGKTVTGGRLNVCRAITNNEADCMSDNNILKASIKASVIEGCTPLTVTFGGENSLGEIGCYEWTTRSNTINTRKVPSEITKLGRTAAFTFKISGTHDVDLTVRGRGNNSENSDAATIQITAYDTEDENCQTASNDKDKLEYEVLIENTGFYIAEVILANGTEGMWGLSVNTANEKSVGGFNGGTLLKENGENPSFMTFELNKPEQVDITLYEYTGQVDTLTIQVEKQDKLRSTLVYGRNISAGTKFTTEKLESGFYVVSIYSQTNSPRGIAGISINADNMKNNVDVGGWIDINSVGFGAFYVEVGEKTQDVKLQLLSGKNYGNVGAVGDFILNIYRQNLSTGERQLYWTNQI
ncbi:MAG: hypothetical protein QM487_13295 [Candidatus Marithrix sp.]